MFTSQHAMCVVLQTTVIQLAPNIIITPVTNSTFRGKLAENLFFSVSSAVFQFGTNDHENLWYHFMNFLQQINPLQRLVLVNNGWYRCNMLILAAHSFSNTILLQLLLQCTTNVMDQSAAITQLHEHFTKSTSKLLHSSMQTSADRQSRQYQVSHMTDEKGETWSPKVRSRPESLVAVFHTHTAATGKARSPRVARL